MEWYTKILRRYADFTGRARRQEYWMFTLINAVIGFAAMLVFAGAGYALGSEVLMYVGVGLLGPYFLAVLVPTVAVTTRRLHDTGRSGWWQLLSLAEFIPVIGWVASIVLLVFCVLDGTPGPNRYGPNPKEAYAGPGWPTTPGAVH